MSATAPMSAFKLSGLPHLWYLMCVLSLYFWLFLCLEHHRFRFSMCLFECFQPFTSNGTCAEKEHNNYNIIRKCKKQSWIHLDRCYQGVRTTLFPAARLKITFTLFVQREAFISLQNIVRSRWKLTKDFDWAILSAH